MKMDIYIKDFKDYRNHFYTMLDEFAQNCERQGIASNRALSIKALDSAVIAQFDEIMRVFDLVHREIAQQQNEIAALAAGNTR